MDAGIIASFKAHYHKLIIRYKIDCLIANKVFAIDVYQAVIMVVMAWSTGVTSSTIVNCWRHTGLLSVLVDIERDAIEKDRFAARIASEVDEVGSLLHQLSLLSSHPEDSNVMDAQEFINFEIDFDLNNSYEPIEEDT